MFTTAALYMYTFSTWGKPCFFKKIDKKLDKVVVVVLGFTSHLQLRSYGDGTTV